MDQVRFADDDAASTTLQLDGGEPYQVSAGHSALLSRVARDHVIPTNRGNVGQFDAFRWMSRSTRVAFEQLARRRRYARGQLIYQEGDVSHEMYRLVEGSLRSYATRDDGREFVHFQLQDGDCFGVADMLDDRVRQDSVTAQSDVELQILSRQQFDTFKAMEPSFGDAICSLLASQVLTLTRHVAGAHLDHCSVRLARILVQTACPDGDNLPSVKLPQAELASMLGKSRQTANKLLKRFAQIGIVRLSYGSVIVLDLARLKNLAQLEE